MNKKCEVCDKPVKYGEGIKLITDRLERQGFTRMHTDCFDDMWSKQIGTDKDYKR